MEKTLSLFERIKEFYENRTRYYLPRRSYTIIRVDGRSFHSYVKGLNKPFDMGLIEDMDNTAIALCKEIMGAQFAYVQSDEISILVTDFNDLVTQAWFDNNLQKMCSLSASIATASFNRLRIVRHLTTKDNLFDGHLLPKKDAQFDSRVFQLPYDTEVANYFISRQQDATRNALSMVAQSLYSAKELNGKKSNDLQEMISKKGVNWDTYDPRLKRGRIIQKITTINKTANLGFSTLSNIDGYPGAGHLGYKTSVGFSDDIIIPNNSIKTSWKSIEIPVFSKDNDFLINLIPKHE